MQQQEWDVMPKELNKVPYELDIELTTYCNLACSFCPRTQLRLKGKHMDFELYKEIIDEFSQKGGIAVKLNYLGEPFMYPHLVQAIRYAYKNGIKKILLNTNGNIPMGIQTIIKCIRNGLSHITFSIDSSKEDTYKEIRKGGNIHDVFMNLFEFYLTRETLHSKTPKIIVQCIKQPKNLEEIESNHFQEHYGKYCDEIRFTDLHHYDRPKLLNTPSKQYIICLDPFRRLVVRVNGKVQPCCEERLDSKIVGDITEQSVEEIWTSPKMNTLRDTLKTSKIHTIEYCRRCPKYRNHLEG